MNKNAKGKFIKKDNEIYYLIDDVYKMEDFFLTISSSSDIWTFLWSRGGITAGRENSDKALFPYYTDDKIQDMKYCTGALEIIKTDDIFWRPFDPAKKNKCSIAISRNLSKVVFEEKNEILGLSFELSWLNSEKYGLIKKTLIKTAKDISFTILDGARNIMPAGMGADFQNNNSTLLDAYKKTDLDESSGLVALALSSIITDRAEPNEALRANITYFTKEGRISLDPEAEENFYDDCLQYSNTSKGERGAAYLVSAIELKKDEEYKCYQVFDTSLSSSEFANLRETLLKTDKKTLEKMIEDDITLSSEKLNSLIRDADGFEDTADLMACVHHEANVLFNIMRGGTFISNNICTSDFMDFLFKRNKKIAKSISIDKEEISYSELKEIMGDDDQKKRLFYEYIPLTFSRRHGDPSRPWNRFNIKIKNDSGMPIMNYEGNWRDIFQNWEALSLSYPMYLDHMITRFLDTMTIDGFNPYKINRDGFDWEEPDLENPWAAIGYWNDHQIIYLVRLLELSKKYSFGGLTSDLSSRRYSTANVPYRIKSYKDLEKNPHSTIVFDKTLSEQLKKEVKDYGSDAKYVRTKEGSVELSTLCTKICEIIVSKAANLVPDGGIWMNTERPEWNDANNALAGFGLSVVTTASLRLLLNWFIDLLKNSSDRAILLSETVYNALFEISSNYKRYGLDFDDEKRLSFVRENGFSFENERMLLYDNGFAKDTEVEKDKIISMLSDILRTVDSTLKHNKRNDGLYHSYNVMEIKDDKLSVLEMKLQLEGQVALLSSGLVDGKEAIEIMSALKCSPLREKITGAYTLYPNKEIPLFWNKNCIKNVAASLISLKDKNGFPILEKDKSGTYHFRADIRNKECLDSVLGYENKAAEDLYEKTFKHRYFTGRSDSFFRYEGLGSIYWHMVSKLMLSIAELIEKETDECIKEKLIEDYREIRSSLGYKREAKDYGSFPFMPYSHTPKAKGAKQPGMTGQVKEEVITRNIELGAKVENGVFKIAPDMLELSEFKEDGKLKYTCFNTPITYTLTDEDEIEIAVNGMGFMKKNALDRNESLDLFNRNGKIKEISVKIPRSKLC